MRLPYEPNQIIRHFQHNQEDQRRGFMAGISKTGQGRLPWFALPLTLVVGGCVSSMLESGQFRPVGAVNSQPQQATAMASDPVTISPVQTAQGTSQPDKTSGQSTDSNIVDEVARQRAIAEMRAKGQQTSGHKTTFGALPETATSQLTDAERQQKALELAEKAEAVNEMISEGEVESKQQSIRRLQQKAKSHYKNAIENIEN